MTYLRFCLTIKNLECMKTALHDYFLLLMLHIQIGQLSKMSHFSKLSKVKTNLPDIPMQNAYNTIIF